MSLSNYEIRKTVISGCLLGVCIAYKDKFSKGRDNAEKKMKTLEFCKDAATVIMLMLGERDEKA